MPSDAATPPRIRMIEMIFPEHANHYGTVFGGHALALMAKAAFVQATRHAGAAVVMARSERVDFSMPIRVGAMLELAAFVTRTVRGSMTVEVGGTAATRTGAAPRPVLTGRFEMVAVDGAGRRKPSRRDIQQREETHDHA